jgi:beta-aspartyl-peptidase (threonine type)
MSPQSFRRGAVLLALGVLLLAAVAGASGEPPQGDSRAGRFAERDIRGLLDDQVTAWNRGDLEGFMKGYWRSDKLTFSSGNDQTKGWQAILDRYRKRYQGEGSEMGKLSFSDLTVEVLGPDSAFVRGRWQLVRRKDRPGGLFTLIVRRFPEGWRIIHDHTSN